MATARIAPEEFTINSSSWVLQLQNGRDWCTISRGKLSAPILQIRTVSKGQTNTAQAEKS